NNTKCMVKVNGVALIDRMLHQLDRLKLQRIVIVVGYERKKLMEYISGLNINTPVEYVENEIYDKTNNIYSLALAKEYLLEDDTLLLESDLIFEDDVLKVLIEDKRETLALVDKYESWMDGTVIKIGEDDAIQSFVPGKKFVFDDIPYYYKTVNIYKFSKHFSRTHYVPFLEAYSKALGNNEYYEQVLRVITLLDDPEIKAKRLNGQLWYEIDDIQDLDIAESMFAQSDDEKVSRLQARYGGYWRYPKLLDFCYLVNPYYPPKKMMDEMKANFEKLLTQYPSGMYVNSLLASKNFGVKRDYIAVGNGAAELIKSIMEKDNGIIGVVSPTFEEYPNRYSSESTVRYMPEKEDFRYDENDLIKYFTANPADSILIVNPDNPTGNYIKYEGIIKLLDWAKSENKKVILDESFIDFADLERVTFISDDMLERYDNLVVIKSISKSYGVPGIRLGVAVSSDIELISFIKKDVAIWNINSFGEFYLQIAEKYKKDYESGLDMFYGARKKLVKELSMIKNIHVMPTQANYVMCSLEGGISAKEVTKKLLVQHNILIKDLSAKMGKSGRKGEFVRIAVRDEKDNKKLVLALKEVMA
ncbi:MAG: aminotransferase class I/II-fold pyridoxal phosphate-dependent enzyme, partial [Lachnospiraceae bacterium]